jgi:hypothetical protein
MTRIQQLTTPWQRAKGAIFHQRLGETVLAFIYPHPAPRKFHTFFCPPLRIQAFDGDGQVIHAQVVRTGGFVSLPATCLVVESDPEIDLPLDELSEIARSTPQSAAQTWTGTWDREASLDRLLFILLATAVMDLRKLKDFVPGKLTLEGIRQQFDVLERGQLTNSAVYIASYEGRYSIPKEAINLSKDLLDTERPYLAELHAASVAGYPWQREIPGSCARCCKNCTWRQVIMTPKSCPQESRWRYGRPENHVPLCRKCIGIMSWGKNQELRISLAKILWRERFEAFQRWHGAFINKTLPEGWEPLEYPLWPPEYGGETWEMGSGAADHAVPMPPSGEKLRILSWRVGQLFPIGQGRKPRKK